MAYPTELSSLPDDAAFDVVVLGAGGAGMSAALFAAIGGAKVLLIESTAQVGGTTDVPDPLTGSHANLLNELSESIAAFQSAIEQIATDPTYGGPSLVDSVTGFTASDFGRTFPTNGQGSDHGWGGEHFVLGGAVNGRDIYGEMPGLTPAGTDDAGWGQIIPKLAVDQYAATLARWFGVSEAQIDLLLPALAGTPRFGAATGGYIGTHRDLGFMQPA